MLRLAKYREAGATLTAESTIALDALSALHPNWRVAKDERDEFPFWMGEVDDSRTFLATPKRTPELARWLHENPTGSDWQDDDWRDRCLNDFPRAATALLRLAQQGDWIVDRWREALQAWSDERLAARSWRYVGDTLASAPDNFIKELAHSLGWWIQTVAKVFTRGEDAFFGLIRKILEQSTYEALPDADVAFRSINHPVGSATEAALRWWFRQGLEDGQGLSGEIEPIFTDLCNPDILIFRYGRLLLATNVIALFRVDPEWTKRCLLPFLIGNVRQKKRGQFGRAFFCPRVFISH
jgi:hypothetical protein